MWTQSGLEESPGGGSGLLVRHLGVQSLYGGMFLIMFLIILSLQQDGSWFHAGDFLAFFYLLPPECEFLNSPSTKGKMKFSFGHDIFKFQLLEIFFLSCIELCTIH